MTEDKSAPDAKIVKPGFYRMPHDKYHADPCPDPSLSSSIARTIITKTPEHARYQHPRMTPQEPDESSRPRDIGSAVHSFTFGGPRVDLIRAKNYKGGEAQKLRDAAYAAGKIPLLEPDLECAMQMAERIKPLITQLVGVRGASETVIAWRERGAWCRTMIDGLSEDKRVFIDLKTTSGSAEPGEAAKRFYADDYDMQAAFIERGLDVLDPENRGRRKCFFVFIENDAPFVPSVIEPSEAGMHIARRRVRAAINLWSRCMATDEWPGYSLKPVRAERPTWSEQAWLNREVEDPSIDIDTTEEVQS